MPKPESVADIQILIEADYRKNRGKPEARDEAVRQLRALGLLAPEIDAIIRKIDAEVLGMPVPAPTKVESRPGLIPSKVEVPTTGEAPQEALRRRFRQRLQPYPQAAFRQFAEAQGAPGGGTFSEQALRSMGESAEQGFSLAPFLQPGAFEGVGGKDPLESFERFGMPQFLRGLAPPGMDTPEAGFLPSAAQFGIPSPQQIRFALSNVGALRGRKTGTPQQAVADILNRPDANRLVFEMIANPISERSGGLFGPMVAALLSRAFSRFQEEQEGKENPLEFLQEVLAGRAGPEFAGMTFR